MPHPRAHLHNKQHERSVLAHRLASAFAYIAMARGFRSLTSSMLLRAFCTPFVRLRPTPEQKAILDDGERFTVRVTGGEATGWRWGRGPAILLVHGWAGRASQLAAWVPALTRRGYSVIAVDQPAHGVSAGSRTNAVVMKDVLMELGSRTGPLAAVVAHSLGGLVSSYALSQGLETGAIVLISSPSAPGRYFERLMKMARIPRDRWSEVMHGAETIFGDTFERIAIRATWQAQQTPALLIHDRGDREVPFAMVAENLDSIPHARVHATEGLGHNRILNDAEVVTESISFIEAQTRPNLHRPLSPDFADRFAPSRPGDEIRISVDEVMADLAYGQR